MQWIEDLACKSESASARSKERQSRTARNDAVENLRIGRGCVGVIENDESGPVTKITDQLILARRVAMKGKAQCRRNLRNELGRGSQRLRATRNKLDGRLRI